MFVANTFSLLAGIKKRVMQGWRGRAARLAFRSRQVLVWLALCACRLQRWESRCRMMKMTMKMKMKIEVDRVPYRFVVLRWLRVDRSEASTENKQATENTQATENQHQ
jgi:hypothetical protein